MSLSNNGKALFAAAAGKPSASPAGQSSETDVAKALKAAKMKAVVAMLGRQKRAAVTAAPATTSKEKSYGLDHKVVLLTGATGFLGAFLLNELLVQTRATVYCLVRATDSAAGKERLWGSLENYQLSTREVFDSRVVALPGDLGKPNLGLDKRVFMNLGSMLDAIVHNGCLVNFMCPYQQLKGPNVMAVAAVIRLATLQGREKVTPIHYISSLSVYGTEADSKVLESDELPSSSEMNEHGAYTQTKWVAEKMLVMARDRGVPVSIHRPGRILGDSVKGTCNDSDFMFRMLKGCSQLGWYPSITWSEVGSPVDYVARAIVYIARHPVSKNAFTPKANYNLVHPDSMPYPQMFRWMRSAGYAMRECRFEDWKKKMSQIPEATAHTNAMYALLPVVAEQGEAGDSMPLFDCTNTLTLLKGSGVVCPAMTARMLTHYLKHIEGIHARRSQMTTSFLLMARVTQPDQGGFEAGDLDVQDTRESAEASFALTFGRSSRNTRSSRSSRAPQASRGSRMSRTSGAGRASQPRSSRLSALRAGR